MKKFIFAALAALALCAAAWQPREAARAESADEAGVRAAVEHYLRGQATGLGEHHRKAFHPEAKLFFTREGKFAQMTSEEYISRSPGKPADDEARRSRRIESVDVTGDAAVAKVVLEYPQVTFTDYMSLLKIEGEWRIVNKTFHADRRPRPQP
ncbi:MAG TPA: nuclear transport factor 2 family protein [Pyrinomonadaceae bacterium]|nr:nuclear transport factor 2 family protein [Pyrinomonadaceae bacterium]